MTEENYKDYKVVKALNSKGLEEEVSKLIKKGWAPLGGIATTPSQPPTGVYRSGLGNDTTPVGGCHEMLYQAMILR